MLGLDAVRSSHSPRDVYLLFLSRFVRLFAFGAIAPILVLYLRDLGFSDQVVGAFLSLTLLGDVLLSLVVTWIADAVGRRRVLVIGGCLMAISGIVFCLSSSFVALQLAAIAGVISPSGNEVGPFSAVEIGMLSGLVNPDQRVFILSGHTVMGFLGTSAGSLVSGGLITFLTRRHDRTSLEAYRVMFLVYSLAAVVKVGMSLALSAHTELDALPTQGPSSARAADERQPLLDDERRSHSADPILRASSTTDQILAPPEDLPVPKLPLGRLVALCFIFSLDSFASSIMPNSYISYYFKIAFSAPVSVIATTFSVGSVLGGLSQLVAGLIAHRLGIIVTMVGTHIPAQIVTILIAFAPNLASALGLFVLRASTASMDAGVRGAFLSAIIPAHSRTRFLGVINVCKTLASAPGPTLSGKLASAGLLRFGFVLTGSLKIIYDLALLAGFVKAKLEH